MISIDELNRVKSERKTNLYYEEKEYLQYIFLNSLSRFADKFVFKGGTCLRICYGFERASEDLDFSSALSLKEIKEIANKCLKDFNLLNIKYEAYAEKEYSGNLRIEARFQGPLFNGDKASTNTLKMDFNTQKVKNKIAKVVPKLFPDVPAFTLVALDRKEILAEKIRALINRGQPRDIYDVWMLFNVGEDIDKKLLAAKLKEENSKLRDIKIPSKEEYNRDLKDLLSYLPPYEQVRDYVLSRLKI